jgi:phosphatidylserine/phosphatidylglycerophosphate/cardiolipin synthase-like enzyme
VTVSLDRFKRTPFPPGYPANCQTFFSPVDDVHGVLVELLKSARNSAVICMYGFDDDEIADIIRSKMESEHLFVQLTLDKSQAGGAHEKALLAKESYPATSIAIGHSERGAIVHLKCIVIDGIYTITGSTNLSTSGETKQSNALVVISDPYVAAEARARIDATHANILSRRASE